MINERYAKKYCREDISLIENYDVASADTTQTWDCHHKNEFLENKTPKELDDEGRYFGVPACELIFMTKSYHRRLHKKGNKNMLGKHRSEETKQKMSIAKQGENHPFFGKHLSEEHKKKLSDANKGKHLSTEAKQKISDKLKGKHHSAETKKKMSIAKQGENHPFFGKHFSAETKQKMSDAKQGENNPMFGKHHSAEAKQKMSIANKDKGTKKVLQFTKTGEFIAEYSSLTEASQKTGIAKSNISACCNGRIKSVGGYVWVFVV